MEGDYKVLGTIIKQLESMENDKNNHESDYEQIKIKFKEALKFSIFPSGPPKNGIYK